MSAAINWSANITRESWCLHVWSLRFYLPPFSPPAYRYSVLNALFSLWRECSVPIESKLTSVIITECMEWYLQEPTLPGSPHVKIEVSYRLPLGCISPLTTSNIILSGPLATGRTHITLTHITLTHLSVCVSHRARRMTNRYPAALAPTPLIRHTERDCVAGTVTPWRVATSSYTWVVSGRPRYAARWTAMELDTRRTAYHSSTATTPSASTGQLGVVRAMQAVD